MSSKGGRGSKSASPARSKVALSAAVPQRGPSVTVSSTSLAEEVVVTTQVTTTTTTTRRLQVQLDGMGTFVVVVVL